MIPKRRVTQSYFNFMLIKYQSLIQVLIYRSNLNLTTIQELESMAHQELLRCMACYDNTIGTFITYFYGRLINMIRHYRDNYKRAKRIQAPWPNHQGTHRRQR